MDSTRSIPVTEAVEGIVDKATRALLQQQAPDGHFVFPLEADATIPAEYILLEHYLDDIDTDIEKRLANYLRRIQGSHGGWSLFQDGDIDISATVKAYFALKLVGDDPEAPHMRRARDAVLGMGGAARSNVFTRGDAAGGDRVGNRQEIAAAAGEQDA